MGNIITPQVSGYLDTLYRPLSPFLEGLRMEAEAELIPIILRDTEALLTNLLLLKQPRRILELGTAVGYSALCFATVLPDCQITTLELSPRSCQRAGENIRKAGEDYESRICIVAGDARETLPKLEPNGFDFLFIDAAKGHYQEFWETCLPLCAPGALIVSDNVLYKGITASEDFLTDRRDKTIMRRMRSFLERITTDPGVITSVLAVGDGVAISALKG